jgi:hypothetical protein
MQRSKEGAERVARGNPCSRARGPASLCDSPSPGPVVASCCQVDRRRNIDGAERASGSFRDIVKQWVSTRHERASCMAPLLRVGAPVRAAPVRAAEERHVHGQGGQASARVEAASGATVLRIAIRRVSPPPHLCLSHACSSLVDQLDGPDDHGKSEASHPRGHPALFGPFAGFVAHRSGASAHAAPKLRSASPGAAPRPRRALLTGPSDETTLVIAVFILIFDFFAGFYTGYLRGFFT